MGRGEQKGVEGETLGQFHVVPGTPFVATVSLELSALCFSQAAKN